MFKSLLKFQQTVGSFKKDAVNPFHKNRYASLGAILEVVMPALHENGFALMQPIERDGDVWGVRTWLYWTGDKASDRIDCGFIPLLECKDPQAQGKAISYNRRYALQTALGLVADDDDAEASCGRGAPPPKFDDRGARAQPKVTPVTPKVTPPAAPSIAEVQAKQEPAKTAGTDAVIAPIPQLSSVVAPEPTKTDSIPFDYKNQDHRKLLVKAVKMAALSPQQLTIARNHFECGAWEKSNLSSDINILADQLKVIANG